MSASFVHEKAWHMSIRALRAGWCSSAPNLRTAAGPIRRLLLRLISGVCGILVASGCTVPSSGFGSGPTSDEVSEQTLRFAPRIALVIGNNNYTKWDRLRLSTNDATAMAQNLKAAGFLLVGGGPHLNVGASDFRQLMTKTVESVRAEPGAIVVVYFSGHGFAYQGHNMVVPVDAPISSTAQASQASLGVADIAQALSAAGSGLTVMLLDACREAIAGTGGFLDTPPPPRTFIGFGTYFGTWSTEGAGPNSAYTTGLLEALKSPWDRLADLHLAAATQVSLSTKFEQVPVYRSAPGVPEARVRFAFSAPESVYARLSRDRPTSDMRRDPSLLGARCSSLVTLNLLYPSGVDTVQILPRSDARAMRMSLVLSRSSVNPKEALSTCRDAYAAGARNPATIRAYAMTVLATAQGGSTELTSAAEVLQAQSLLLQAAEGGDGIAETFLAMTDAGVPSKVGNAPQNPRLAGQRLLHAVEVNKSPVAWMVGLSLIEPGLGWSNREFDLTRDAVRGFRIIVDAARRNDPMAVEILASRRFDSLARSENVDVRSLLRTSLVSQPPTDWLGAVAYSGLTVGQTLHALAMLDAIDSDHGSVDLPGFIRLAMVAEQWAPKFLSTLVGHPGMTALVGCALVGGFSSRYPLAPTSRNVPIGVRFLQIAADQGDAPARQALQALRAGYQEPCVVDADGITRLLAGHRQGSFR